MENNQHQGNQSNNQTSNQTIPPVVPTPPAPRSSEDFRRQWRDHRGCRMAIGLVIAILVAIIIFAAGVMVGRFSSRRPAYGIMNSGAYSQRMHRRMSAGAATGTSGMNQMQMNNGMGADSGAAGMAAPGVPKNTAPSSNTAPANQ